MIPNFYNTGKTDFFSRNSSYNNETNNFATYVFLTAPYLKNQTFLDKQIPIWMSIYYSI